jgi:hypothetical protein
MPSAVELKRWKRVEYEQLVERGVFDTGDRVELIDGLLIVAEPQSATHYTAIPYTAIPSLDGTRTSHGYSAPTPQEQMAIMGTLTMILLVVALGLAL